MKKKVRIVLNLTPEMYGLLKSFSKEGNVEQKVMELIHYSLNRIMDKF